MSPLDLKTGVETKTATKIDPLSGWIASNDSSYVSGTSSWPLLGITIGED